MRLPHWFIMGIGLFSLRLLQVKLALPQGVYLFRRGLARQSRPRRSAEKAEHLSSMLHLTRSPGAQRSCRAVCSSLDWRDVQVLTKKRPPTQL